MKTFYEGIMKQKQIDHEASHSNLINQWLHLVSSGMFLYCYATFTNDYRFAVYFAIASLILRQSGHYIFEPPCHDKEQAMLGFDTRNKVRVCILYFVLPSLFLVQLTQWGKTAAIFTKYDVSVADVWLVATFAVVGGRVLTLWFRYGFLVSMHWFVKFMTDPFTDFPAYWRAGYQITSPKLFKFALHKSFPNTFNAPDISVEEIREFEHGAGFHGKGDKADAVEAV